MNSKPPYVHNSNRAGLTWIEIIVILVVILLLVSLLMPAVRTARFAARRTQCSNNLKMLGLALHNYHDVYTCFPSAMGGTGVGATDYDGNANRLSGIIPLSPFLECNPFYDTVSNELEANGRTYPPMGPAPWVREYPPWQETFGHLLHCPSSPLEEDSIGTNYAFSIGDVTRNIHTPSQSRGAFAPGICTTLEEFEDGASQTIAMAEIGSLDGRLARGQIAIKRAGVLLDQPALCLKTLSEPGSDTYCTDPKLSTDGRGANWVDGSAPHSLFNTILPPNSPSCAVGDGNATDGVYSAGSAHPDGAQVLYMDGSVRFISNTIDAGNPKSKPVASGDELGKGIASPYGVWGALGSRIGDEQIQSSQVDP